MNNMKKNIEKILASASIIIAMVLIVILLVTAFGGIEQKEFDNDLVKGLFITLAVLYLLLAGGMLTMLFIGSEAVREITLRSEQGGNCKATLGVIRRLVKETFYGIDGVKTGRVGLIVNEYGVKLKVSVRIVDRDVFETETYLRTLLEEVFKGALGFRFHAIEIKITSLQAKFKPDTAKVQETVAEKVAAHQPNYATLPNTVEQVSVEKAEEPAVEDVEETAVAETAAEETAAADNYESTVELDENVSGEDAVEQIPEDGAYVEEDIAEEADASDDAEAEADNEVEEETLEEKGKVDEE